ncbi:60S ribosome biogenesis protein Rrp14, putative [Talaromyces stipitatus ATCC 10500]|uniref:60S ribosome biogenesis protein Rrp14, putative n=1 Tax=Talaromyces stipitatus (strain ATCC 10500 / CBS 375.48 / QM 6759 / NRRL 1006) TaxID=441959 RepID=B8LUL9_TALSN|nr:60S ribosome biogenesis protein Rrp14, putative [Talaromyces stipitatus ATCC 10500]EED23876.1 60S ribosome biogenesis protein Rrp14, putative [Talaromyces stipitatus ATCC 10500]
MADIEERLRSHSDAFSGLMSLIPAKYYYEEDHSDQWQRKKQTKEEAKNAKLAKLDPDAAKSAKDVMDENARKRKREDGIEEDNQSQSAESELGSELPKEGLKRGDLKSKKQKQIDAAEKDNKDRNAEAEERRKLKAEKKAEKKAAQREKKKAKEAAKADKKKNVDEQSQPAAKPSTTTQKSSADEKSDKEPPVKDHNVDQEELDVVEGFDLETKNSALEETSSTTSSNPDSSNFEMSNNSSGTSSTSSIIPPSEAPSQQATKPTLKPLKTTPEELRQRLQKRLDELRAARRADGLNGKPARTRQELIEARRRKAEERKQHKKELRRKAKEEEELKKDEEMQRRFSPGGSGSLLASPRSPAESFTSNSNTNFAFGRIAFPDGQHADPTLSRLLDDKSKHGPRDPAAALKAAEAKKTRLSSLDEQKRAEIEEKDMWLNAKKRAHGERVRDDTSLLKKALKRKESAKKKSEREWKERLEGVAKGKEMRQQRREENIRKRKEDRGNAGGKKAGGGNNNKGKSKARPGFEGSFRAKNGDGSGKKK